MRHEKIGCRRYFPWAKNTIFTSEPLYITCWRQLNSLQSLNIRGMITAMMFLEIPVFHV